MTKRVETEDNTEISLLSSNYGDIPEYILSSTPASLQGTNEVPCASFLQVFPVSRRYRQVEQNLLMVNFYLIRLSISDSKEYSVERFIADSHKQIG